MALKEGHVNIVRLQYKISINISAFDLTKPLLYAIRENRINMVRLLLDNSAPINISGEYGSIL